MFRLMATLLAIISLGNVADSRADEVLANLARLQKGEILHEYTRRDEPGGSIRAEILIQSKLQPIWDLLTGCGEAFVFVDGLEVCEILEISSERARIHQVADPGILAPEQDYIYQTEFQPFSRMDFKLVEGTLDALEGSWQFFEVPGGVVITYNMHVQPGIPVPRFLVRGSIRRTITGMLACIRGLVSGSGGAEALEDDLGRCKGEN